MVFESEVKVKTPRESNVTFTQTTTLTTKECILKEGFLVLFTSRTELTKIIPTSHAQHNGQKRQ